MTALIKLKECEDAHLGEEVDRNWFEVVTQQYIFDRLNKEVRHTRFYLVLYIPPPITEIPDVFYPATNQILIPGLRAGQ